MKTKVKQLTFDNFPDKIETPSVILFSRQGCHFCRELKPIYDKLSLEKKYEDVYDFYVVDADEEELLYEKFSPDGVPTIFVIYEDDGVEIPYPKSPPPSGYGKEDIEDFLDKLMED
jgi:thioredoxin-like negative regulator of GroEL